MARPSERTGVYVGVFNMFIVIPMLLAGALMACGAVATLRVPRGEPAAAVACV